MAGMTTALAAVWLAAGQTGAAAPAIAAPKAPAIRSLRVEGAERIEADTVLSYAKLAIGDPSTAARIDQALRDLHASGLFAEVAIRGVTDGNIVVVVRENPIVNRVILEGNKRLKEDKLRPEIKLAARQVFSRSAVRGDIERILQLYRRQGRYAARIEPKMVVQTQNRVDVIYEITEGPKSKVRQINILGNERFDDGELRKQMATKQARLTRFMSSSTSYDEDRMAYDQQKLRQFYLTQGYADFRVISAVAELTRDKRDFVITYVVEEGARYKLGPVTVKSDLRTLDEKTVASMLSLHEGEWFDASAVERQIEALNGVAGRIGYAAPVVTPQYDRDGEAHRMGLTFRVAEAQRSYVERIEITGNSRSDDKIVRREIRLNEGDLYDNMAVKRSQDRLGSLGYFQDKLEIAQKPGSSDDRVVLAANVEEKSTGELSLSAGYSSLESFLISAGIKQNNFRGKGQTLSLQGSYSAYSKSIELGFTEPYLFDTNVAAGLSVFRRDYRSFNTLSDSNETTYRQVSTGFQLTAGVPLSEYWSGSLRYRLSNDAVSLDEDTYYTNGVCDPALAGQYLCDAVGTRLTSSVGASLIYDSTNSRLYPTRGSRFTVTGDFAGLGGDVRYVRGTAAAATFKDLGGGFVASAKVDGGVITGLGQDVRLIDRFFLGDPQMRGFDIRGVGPRVTRTYYDTSTVPATLLTDEDSTTQDALGGTAYYHGRLELELPLGGGAREMGLRPSIYVDVGGLWGGPTPTLTDSCASANAAGTACVAAMRQYTITSGQLLYLDSDGNSTTTVTDTPYIYSLGTYRESYSSNSALPRVSIGIGVGWNSPFGPLRFDLAKAIRSQPGEDTKLFTFTVGTAF
jgi:outer membrane protein insertion porin family